MSNAAQIDDDSLDTVAFTFNLGLKTFHLIAIKRVGDILLWQSANHAQVGEAKDS